MGGCTSTEEKANGNHSSGGRSTAAGGGGGMMLPARLQTEGLAVPANHAQQLTITLKEDLDDLSLPPIRILSTDEALRAAVEAEATENETPSPHNEVIENGKIIPIAESKYGQAMAAAAANAPTLVERGASERTLRQYVSHYNIILFFPIPSLSCKYFLRGEKCERAIGTCRYSHEHNSLSRFLSILNGAKKTLDICVATIGSPAITQSLIRSHRRGVTVRVLMDNGDPSQSLSFTNDRQELRAAGISVRIDDSRFHNKMKFAVIDTKVCLNGSFSWTTTAMMGARETVQITDHQFIIAKLYGEFNRLWAQFAHTDNTVSVMVRAGTASTLALANGGMSPTPPAAAQPQSTPPSLPPPLSLAVADTKTNFAGSAGSGGAAMGTTGGASSGGGGGGSGQLSLAAIAEVPTPGSTASAASSSSGNNGLPGSIATPTNLIPTTAVVTSAPTTASSPAAAAVTAAAAAASLAPLPTLQPLPPALLAPPVGLVFGSGTTAPPPAAAAGTGSGSSSADAAAARAASHSDNLATALTAAEQITTNKV